MELANLSEAIKEISGDLATASRGLASASRRLHKLAVALEVENEADRSDLDPVVLELLSKRLGRDNQNILIELALRYTPEATFTLEDVAELMDERVPSVRARLMNIGRSLRSMDADMTRLFDIVWEPDREANRYLWDNVAHRTVLWQVKHYDVKPENVLVAENALKAYTDKMLRDRQVALVKLGVAEEPESK